MEGKQNHAQYTVSVRIRPSISNNSDPIFVGHKNKFIKHLQEKSIITYGFDRVYQPQSTNQDIYKDSVKGVVLHFLKNKINTTFLAYGQTGSGKTYTLFGHNNQLGQNRGLCEFIIEEILEETKSNKPIYCSLMQVYKEKVTDLISGETINLRDNGKGEMIMDNKTLNKVTTKEEILKLLKTAYKNKIFGKSYVHSQSSRSHVILCIEIQGLSAKLNVVDLCGSEVLTYQFDERQRAETNSINLSLFTLNSIIHDLCDKQAQRYIPFRNSVLTRILKPSLMNVNKSQVYLICNISPQRQHQDFSTSTLRFGQLAIQIDENQNYVSEKINLSQKKRQLKKVSNIIELSPEALTRYPSYEVPWEISKIKIKDLSIIVYEIKKNKDNVNILFLHAYGGGCSGTDWNGFINYFLKALPDANIYSVDFPGFGNSGGKKFTSRAQKFNQKQQPTQFMVDLFKVFNFTSKNKVYLIGYDLGGAIALNSSFQPSLAKCIKGTIAFHPTWTDSIDKLQSISVNLPVLLIWSPVETFHLVSAGKKMAKTIKNCLLYLLNIGPYTNQKAGGLYDMYSNTISNIMIQFINSQSPQSENIIRQRERGERGVIVQEEIMGLTQKQKELEAIQNSVKQFYYLIESKSQKEIYQSIIKGGQNKPKAIRLAAQLPTLDTSICFKNLIKFRLINSGPKSLINFQVLPLFIPGRQVHVKARINMSVLKGQGAYLALDDKGQIGITHRAYIEEGQTQQQILQQQKIKVKVKEQNGKTKQLSVDLDDVIRLNSPTVFKHNALGDLVFEDSVTCKYSSKIVKLKMIECLFAIKQLIPKMDFSKNNTELLDLQKQCTKRIFNQMDLKHLVHEGIDNSRFTGIQLGRLAYYGQGNCHHLASVAAGLLLPFGKLLGWDVMFRGGSFFKTGREIDQDGRPIQGWNGKPNTKVEDHTWLQILYKPSYQLTVFDPSFNICSAPVDEIYTFEGRMHISGKSLSGSLEPQIPNNLYSEQLTLIEIKQ